MKLRLRMICKIYFLIKMELGQIKRKIKFNILKIHWREKNQHNGSIYNSLFNQDLVTVGIQSYGELNVVSFSDVSKLIIGNYVSIAEHVTFLLDVEHHYNYISTFPFLVKALYCTTNEAFGKGNIVVDDDVWIGYNSLILSGVHIGQGAVVAAGSVVTKDIAPYSIVAGNPAKVIRKRFSDEIIQKLEEINYQKLTPEIIRRHKDEFYKEILDKKDLKWIEKIIEDINENN